MALAPSITNSAKSAAANAVTVLVDAGSLAGRLRIYAGTMPANADAALSGNTLLADLQMSDPSFAAAVNGVATANAIASDTSADASGTATFFRCGGWDGSTFTAVLQGSAGTVSCDLILGSAAIALGGTIAVTSLTYTQQG